MLTIDIGYKLVFSWIAQVMWVDPGIKMECFIECGLYFQVERIFDNNWFSFLLIHSEHDKQKKKNL